MLRQYLVAGAQARQRHECRAEFAPQVSPQRNVAGPSREPISLWDGRRFLGFQAILVGFMAEEPLPHALMEAARVTATRDVRIPFRDAFIVFSSSLLDSLC